LISARGYMQLIRKYRPYLAIRFFFNMAQQPLVGQVLLIIEASLSHSDTPHPVVLLWASD